jgi:hypothetical protein
LVVIILQSRRYPLVAGVLMVAISACSGAPGFLPVPRNPLVRSPVTISRDGRVITVRADRPCGHRPLLIARSYRHRVTLRLVNLDTNCHEELVPVIAVSVTLPSPLGTRHLVQAMTGKPISFQVSRSPRSMG